MNFITVDGKIQIVEAALLEVLETYLPVNLRDGGDRVHIKFDLDDKVLRRLNNSKSSTGKRQNPNLVVTKRMGLTIDGMRVLDDDPFNLDIQSNLSTGIITVNHVLVCKDAPFVLKYRKK